jgi:predicted nucleic acid-binding protein
MHQFLRRHRRIALDTSVFIFQVEGHKKYLELAGSVFAWIEDAGHHAVTSTITMLELLVQPYRLEDLDRVNRMYALLSTYPHLDWVAPTLEIADRAARLRAEYRLKTPDALQLATALAWQASGFITNDLAFQGAPELEVAVLEQMLADGRR